MTLFELCSIAAIELFNPLELDLPIVIRKQMTRAIKRVYAQKILKALRLRYTGAPRIIHELNTISPDKRIQCNEDYHEQGMESLKISIGDVVLQWEDVTGYYIEFQGDGYALVDDSYYRDLMREGLMEKYKPDSEYLGLVRNEFESLGYL